jgi:hypothetical protein
VIERRLKAAAAGDFVVALYNPRSQGRDWQLGRAQALLLEHRPATTPVLLARQLGRAAEATSLHTLADLPIEAVDMLTLVLIGNSSTRADAGRLVTPGAIRGPSWPRGRPGQLSSPKTWASPSSLNKKTANGITRSPAPMGSGRALFHQSG